MSRLRKVGFGIVALCAFTMATSPLSTANAQNTDKAISVLDRIDQLLAKMQDRIKSGNVASAETMKCPACGMKMTTTRTASNTKSVKIKGKTWFCCAGCDMSAIIDK